MDELAVVLRYPSRDALIQARRRGQIPIDLIRLPRRRGLFATATAVASFLNDIERCARRAGCRAEEQ